jgi:hypothetical protein
MIVVVVLGVSDADGHRGGIKDRHRSNNFASLAKIYIAFLTNVWVFSSKRF